ncbi:hypothetical protein BE17_37955 [Sorangium cellulosum]|uniref:Uncharacterized protein n=1 Tax=Sorangium cellulosum TaxID=56 RepID=A0A150R753_SORCE|nr:hypothetical protein BE17_37955 [Sorangium cellulosum]
MEYTMDAAAQQRLDACFADIDQTLNRSDSRECSRWFLRTSIAAVISCGLSAAHVKLLEINGKMIDGGGHRYRPRAGGR